MKISIWMVTRERDTWILLAELLVLLFILIGGSAGGIGVVVGVALLAHVGYRALTSLPMGRVPGRPEGSKQVRRNLDLRSRVVGFLNEMRRVESLGHQATVGGRPLEDLERDLAWAKRRLAAAADEVIAAAGRPLPPEPEEGGRASDGNALDALFGARAARRAGRARTRPGGAHRQEPIHPA